MVRWKTVMKAVRHQQPLQVRLWKGEDRDGSRRQRALDARNALALSGKIREFAIPTAGSVPLEITAGPDGAIWFTEVNGNNIGRITTAGKIREYPIPTANSAPVGITAGPDCTLWFTESSTNQIGQLR